MGLGTIANMSGALSAIAPEQSDALGRITSQALRLLPILKSEAAKGDALTASEADKDARFEEGKPADPTVNMSEEQKADWKAMNEEHRDKFKTAECDGQGPGHGNCDECDKPPFGRGGGRPGSGPKPDGSGPHGEGPKTGLGLGPCDDTAWKA
jgi:hypothetical protein